MSSSADWFEHMLGGALAAGGGMMAGAGAGPVGSIIGGAIASAPYVAAQYRDIKNVVSHGDNAPTQKGDTKFFQDYSDVDNTLNGNYDKLANYMRSPITPAAPNKQISGLASDTGNRTPTKIDSSGDGTNSTFHQIYSAPPQTQSSQSAPSINTVSNSPSTPSTKENPYLVSDRNLKKNITAADRDIRSFLKHIYRTL